MEVEPRRLPSFASILYARSKEGDYTSGMEGEMLQRDQHAGSPGSCATSAPSPVLSAMSSIGSNMGYGTGWSPESSTLGMPSVSPPPVRSSMMRDHLSPVRAGSSKGTPVPSLNLGGKEHGSECHKADAPYEKIIGANRVGGQDWVQRRKVDCMNRAYHYKASNRALQIAQVRKAVEKLQGALPVDAKTLFLQEIRRYLECETSPEEFAEAIKKFVDDHGVVIPLNDRPVGGCEVRDHGHGAPSKPAVRLGKRGNSGPLKGTAVVSKKIKEEGFPGQKASTSGMPLESLHCVGIPRKQNGNSASNRRGPRKGGLWDTTEKPAASGLAMKKSAAEDTSAWEALLSVCSGISA